jgi:hypothetical protein
VTWVFVFGGIALAGLLMLVAYAVWLAHKASDVFGELKVLGARSEQLVELVSQIKMGESPADLEEIRGDPLPQRGRSRGRGRGVRSRRSRAGHR